MSQANTEIGKELPPVIRIRPSRGWISVDLRELWNYRELLYFLTWRDIKVRYKQTVLGAAWAIIQPFMIMVVFSLFFGRLAKIPSDGLPYPIFAFSALIPLLFVLPRLTDSLHPGSGGNPGFNAYDLDNNLRMVFYPAVVAWTGLGFWLTDLRIRWRRLVRATEEFV